LPSVYNAGSPRRGDSRALERGSPVVAVWAGPAMPRSGVPAGADLGRVLRFPEARAATTREEMPHAKRAIRYRQRHGRPAAPAHPRGGHVAARGAEGPRVVWGA